MLNIYDQDLSEYNKTKIKNLLISFLYEINSFNGKATFYKFIDSLFIENFNVGKKFNMKAEEFLYSINVFSENIDEDEIAQYKLFLFLINLYYSAKEKIDEEILNYNWRPYSQVLKPLFQNNYILEFIKNTNYKLEKVADKENKVILSKNNFFVLIPKFEAELIKSLKIDSHNNANTNYLSEMQKFYNINIKNNLEEKVKILRNISPLWDKYHLSHKNNNDKNSIIFKIWKELGKELNNGEINIRHNNEQKNEIQENLKIKKVDYIMKLFLSAMLFVNF